MVVRKKLSPLQASWREKFTNVRKTVWAKKKNLRIKELREEEQKFLSKQLQGIWGFHQPANNIRYNKIRESRGIAAFRVQGREPTLKACDLKFCTFLFSVFI